MEPGVHPRNILNSLFLRRQHHHELSAFHLRKLLHGTVLFQVIFYPLQELDAELLMSHLTATKTQGTFVLSP